MDSISMNTEVLAGISFLVQKRHCSYTHPAVRRHCETMFIRTAPNGRRSEPTPPKLPDIPSPFATPLLTPTRCTKTLYVVMVRRIICGILSQDEALRSSLAKSTRYIFRWENTPPARHGIGWQPRET